MNAYTLYPTSTFKRLLRRINPALEIDEITTGASLSTEAWPSTKEYFTSKDDLGKEKK
jgi:hypothetical protein